MIERYIIKDLIYQGYWSAQHRTFKGVIFATQYITEQDARSVILSDIEAGSYEIIKIYRK